MLFVVVIFFATVFCVSEWLVGDCVAIAVARLYLGWWALCLVASALNLLDIYPVSPFAYFLLLLNVAMFMAGFIAAGRGDDRAVERDALGPLARSFDQRVVANRAMLAVLIGLSVYYVRYLEVLADVGPSEARNIRFSIGTIFGSAFEALMFNYFAEALAIVLVVIVAYSLVLGSIRNWVFFWALVDLYLFASIGAGRTLIVEAGVFVLFLAFVRSALRPRSREGESKDEPGAGARCFPPWR
jgi:magnesium-transporting ATPase (P-type)